MKTCVDCREEKPREAFGLRTAAADGITNHCSVCARARSLKSYYKNHAHNVERQRRHYMKRVYGMTHEEFLQMYDEHGGCCASCGDPRLPRGTAATTIHIDHCHVTGKVRGLLCNNCNHALGQLKDDPQRILALLDYLTRTA